MKIKEKENKKYEETLELVKDINQNSDFAGLELLEFSYHAKEDQQSQGTSDILPYFSEEVKDGIEGIYFMYPYDSKDYRLANIGITQIPYHIFGITVGHNFNEATKVIEKKGFTKYEANSDDDVDFILYRNYHVTVNFKVSKDTGAISAITISVYDKEDDGIY